MKLQIVALSLMAAMCTALGGCSGEGGKTKPEWETKHPVAFRLVELKRILTADIDRLIETEDSYWRTREELIKLLGREYVDSKYPDTPKKSILTILGEVDFKILDHILELEKKREQLISGID